MFYQWGLSLQYLEDFIIDLENFLDFVIMRSIENTYVPLVGSVFKFPPGHRIRVEYFVQELHTSKCMT